MTNLERELAPYGFNFPRKLIAKTPASPRDQAQILIYSRADDGVCFDKFTNLTKYLPARCVLVFNQTKVIPARLELKKETGGKVKVLYIATENGLLKIMADRKIKVGGRLSLSPKIFFDVAGQKEKYYFLKPSFGAAKILSVLNKHGEAPLPPYIKNSLLTRKEKIERYQTVFAKTTGSIAAPTASLHFTRRLLNKIRKAGIGVKFVTLHVSLGTFAPLTDSQLRSGKLHEEYFEIEKTTADFLNKAKKENRPIIAVGTTVARTLESAAGPDGRITKHNGTTDIFIREGYQFKITDGIITNFHVPRSSLLMLASAFVPRPRLLDLYDRAIKKKFKLFSFGDGMLIT